MKQKPEIIIMILSWFAVVVQFILIILNRQAAIFETIVRFFSFFTILTNILVGLYFTTIVCHLYKFPFSLFRNKGALTAITAFIFIVGLVYQVVLRNIWAPTGLQFIIDELLHTVIPIFMLFYWFFNIRQYEVKILPLALWLLYPLVFIIFLLLRGHFSGYYPYPFLNVTEIGYYQTFTNVGIIFGVALIVLSILLLIGKTIFKNKP
ncbi:Pr6Pr family membrane protein [Cellulophaga sp. F20128]|uniref:Pr6Pr family membrane protein n=1 Tax=Cellulophaga sp. F20128 TaxID=2926413 RepID=UPI001FF58E47|nr:Pr6Pr family membrane protein [Cellulophaga sp. F20128]MCK0158889.1 Pr6Pr family membrane protein [Cellulophaga sp. F20128]